MVDEYGAKAASQRKMRRRSDKDACLNNLRLNLNLAYTSHRDQSHQSLGGAKGFEHPHLGRRRDKLLQGSLDDVSSNPLGEFLSEESSLRRSRSLAIAREDVFTSLEIPTQRRRSQLIPRAKLIDRTSFKDRCLKHVRSQESLRINECILLKRKTSITSEVVVSKCTTVNSTGKSQSTVTQKRKSRAKESPFIHANNIRTEIRSEIDSPDSDCQNKTGIQDSLTYSDIGLDLPNYYPDSKCDTDASLTDNVSVLDDKIVEHPSHGKLTSLDNLCKQLEKAKDNSQQNDSIPYDENIVLSKNTPLYDSIGDYPYEIKPFYKPKTIRGGTPYLRENDSYCSEEPQSLPIYVASGVATYDSDSTLSECNFAYYKSGKSKPNEANKFEFAESDTNFDEIKLSNENIKLIHRDKVTENVLYDSKSESSNVEVNPIYEDKAHLENDTAEESYLHISESKPIKSYCSLPQDINIITLREEPKQERVKTSIIVQAADDANVNSVEGEEYKTIINVEADNSPFTKQQSPSQESKRHSHNYLREFLESQKGSKKPLQNFLAKKISRAFGDRNSKSTNLKENQYSSLPDITVSKNLRKCDKIDRKLRKCQNQKVPKPQNDTTTNRFIVNIGRHFDVTAQSNVPVDFEVKISKIPKQQKAKQKPSKNDSSNNKRDEDEEKNLLEAIRNLKETLSGKEERNLDKPEIVAVHKKIDPNKNTDNLKEANSQSSKMERKNSIDKEYQEKVETMRSYWDKIANDAAEKATTDAKSRENENKEDTKENNKGGTYRCKIVEVQTKVDEVKKLFEENSAGKWPGKVQMAKQVFETKSKNEVNGTSSNAYVKECKEMFENPYFERESSNQFESLNPIVMEIIEQDGKKNTENEEENNADNLKKHKPVGKAKSISIEPEFDHVRYRIMKSDVFQKKIFANCDKESQFDGLMQYLQDYSFQELLIDNNIVIIEPIRSNVKYEPHKSKMTRNVTQLLHKTNNSTNNSGKSLRRHFFYHPIRVNREVNDDELPNPDTVKQVRQFFEGGLKRTQSSKNLEEIAKQSIQYNNVDPDKDRCSATDTNSSTMSDYGSNENLFESLEELCCDNQYVSEDILARIREQGTSITYYGGRVLNKYNGKSSSLTKAIMDEIRKNSSKSNDCQCRKNPDNKHHKSVTFADTNGNASDNKDSYQGIKFKLLKSNSCSSRLELVGTKDLSEYRNKYLNKQKQLLDEQNKKKQVENEGASTEKSYTEITTINLKNFKAINDLRKDETNRHVILQIDKNTVNENIKRQDERSPKIIGEEIKTPTIKMTQWSEMSGERNCLGTNKSAKINYNDYHNVDKINRKTRKDHEMEFEPYEIAGN